MAEYLLKRMAVNVVVFLAITLGIFALVHAAPGDPVAMLVGPEQMASGGADYVAHQREALGLNRPLPVQYLSWLGSAVSGDLGYSFVNNRPVSTVLAERIGPTVELMGLGLLLSIAIGIPLGVLAAARRNTIVDYAATVFSLTVISVPSFFIGILGIFFFALELGWLPSSGMVTPGQESILDSAQHLLLPVIILGLAGAGPIVRYVRSGMIGELLEDYTRTAEAKGASSRRVLWRHCFRNSLIPLIAVIALSIPNLLAGAVVIEQVFAWPGMGQLALSSIFQNDYPVVIGFSVVVAILVLASNMLADFLYTAADPRVRLR